MHTFVGNVTLFNSMMQAAGLPKDGTFVYEVEKGVVTIRKQKIAPTDAWKLARGYLRKHRGNLFPRFHTVDNTIFCAVEYKGRVRTGTAVCSPNDVFCQSIGEALAFSRATGKALPPELQEYLDI